MRYGAGFTFMTVAALLLGPVAAARAEDEDAPGRGVARISVINGDVSVRRGDSGDWVAAAVNAPLMVEDTVATGPGSRAEVQFDYANLLRLGPNAEVRLTEVENRRYQMQVARGTVEFRVLRDTDAYVEVSTPQVSVRPSRKGAYRVTVFEDGRQAEIAVRSGEADIYTPRGVEQLKSGRSMLVRGGDSGPEYQFASAPPRDEFDRWNEERDRYLERSASYRYVSPSIYGAEDLDGHGRWVYDAPYGWVWVPGVGPGWAPYSYGRWVWQDWYGWTWLSYDSWGWAPFHYGRWYHGHHGWSWYPGARYSRHYWRPGLVAFFGFGHGVHVGVGFGSLGWVPLAPYEPYHAWYGRGYYGRGGYVDRSINITNINVTNVYRNARVRNAVSAVDYDGFGRGRQNIQRVGELREASLMKGPLPVAPGRESVRFSDREVRNAPRSSAGAEKFYTRRQPTPVQRISFADQQRNFRQAGESRTTPPSVARGEGAARSGAVGRGTEDRGGTTGWRRFGDRQQNAAPAQTRTSEGAARTGDSVRRSTGSAAAGAGNEKRSGGWRRFGESSSPGATQPQATPQRRTEDAVRGTPRANGTSGNWQRFGEPGQAAPARRAESSSSSSSGRSWQSFGSPSRGARESSRGTEDRGSSAGRVDRSESYSRPSGRQESIRIAPPVVRERSAPQVESAPRSVPRTESYSRGSGSSYSRSQGSSGAYSGGRSSGGSPSGSSRGAGSSSGGSGRSSGHGSGRGR